MPAPITKEKVRHQPSENKGSTREKKREKSEDRSAEKADPPQHTARVPSDIRAGEVVNVTPPQSSKLEPHMRRMTSKSKESNSLAKKMRKIMRTGNTNRTPTKMSSEIRSNEETKGPPKRNKGSAKIRGKKSSDRPTNSPDEGGHIYEGSDEAINDPQSYSIRKPKVEGEKPKKPSFATGYQLQANAGKRSFEVVSLLSSGTYGDVYASKDKETNKYYALYTEMKGLKCGKLKTTFQLSDNLGDRRPAVSHLINVILNGRTKECYFLVTTLYGPSLDVVRKDPLIKSFSRATALSICIQMLNAIRELHNSGYVHRNFSPGDFCIGFGDQDKQIVLVNVGSAKRLYDSSKQKRLVRRWHSASKLFCSRGAHNHHPVTKKDDMESWFFSCANIFNEEILTWRDKVPEAGSKENDDEILSLKSQFFTVKGPLWHPKSKESQMFPKEFRYIMCYIDTQEADNEFNYDFLMKMLTDAIPPENNIVLGQPLDWRGLFTEPEFLHTTEAPTPK